MDPTTKIEDKETAISKTLKRKKGDEVGPNLPLVPPDGSGRGLPYAPEDWPNPGDIWTWRVGRRITSNGHFLDRYLYLPARLRKGDYSFCKNRGFASKLSVERYIRAAFPDADVNAFFLSFSWKIPARPSPFNDVKWFLPPPSEDLTEDTLSDSQSSVSVCKAKNKNCESLVAEAAATKNPLMMVAMPCDICCSEPRFCRDCCCILCCKTVSSNFGGYSYIKCQAVVVDEGYICGHVAHLNCALRTYMAGTVGGTIGLDAEYYCRRCDVRTSLIPHVMKLLQSCESIDSRVEVEKMLNLGVCILRGSQRTDVKRLLNRIESAMSKLKCGTILKDIWKDGEALVISTDVSPMDDETREATEYHDLSETRASSSDVASETSDCSNEIVKIEDEINLVLQELRNSQEAEFRLAEERLHAQKRYLHNLYQQLGKERSNLLSQMLDADKNALEYAISSRMNQIKGEVVKLKDMEGVASGFGKTSKKILKELFGLEVVE